MDRVKLICLFDVYETLLTDREKEIFKYTLITFAKKY